MSSTGAAGKLDSLINLMTSIDAKLTTLQVRIDEINTHLNSQTIKPQIPTDVVKEAVTVEEVQGKFADAMNNFNEDYKPQVGNTKYRISSMNIKFKGVAHFDKKKNLKLLSPDKVANVSPTDITEIQFDIKTKSQVKTIASFDRLRRIEAMRESRRTHMTNKNTKKIKPTVKKTKS
jgi:hypothetical protein